MRQLEFERRHGADWDAFGRWLAQRGRRRKKSEAAPDDALPNAEVPARFRQLCAQLALARARQYSPSLIDRLNQLVLAGHQALYGASSGWFGAPWRFIGAEFPALVRAERGVVGLAALLFFGPLLGLTIAVQFFPHLAALLLTPMQMSQVEAMYQPDLDQLGMRDSSTNMLMFGYYIWNNVRIGFQTFAGGLLVGLGSVFFLLYNGLYIGAILGHLTQAGLGPQIWSFVSGHSALELLAIAISGGAGFKLGVALIAPGRRSRRLALLENARIALKLMLGAALMFLAAAAVEAFYSPLNLSDPWPKYLVGALFWIVLLAYFHRAGRPRGA
jgi:uncharacterized membrane protein SpoIIM required for sporulation